MFNFLQNTASSIVGENTTETVSDMSKVNNCFDLFRLGFKKSLDGFGVPRFGKWLKYVSIFISFCSLLGGCLSFIPAISRAQCSPESFISCLFVYIFACYCILLSIALLFYEHIIGRFLIYSYLVRGILYIIFALPCFVIPLGSIAAILTICLGAAYIFSWLRLEDGSDNECEPCIKFIFKRNDQENTIYGGGEENDFQNAEL